MLEAYNPSQFLEQAQTVSRILSDHLEAMDRREGPVLPAKSPTEMLTEWDTDFSAAGTRDLPAFLERFLEDCNHLHHPRYVGHQVTSPLPQNALLDFASALLNNGSAIYEMGPASTVMERIVARYFASRMGFDTTRSDGLLTHGGSAGNLTCLLAARQQALNYDVWEEGLCDVSNVCLITGDQAHYSLRRSAQIMGLGGRSVWGVPTDERFRMRPEALREQLEKAQKENRTVLCVVASAGSTATGAIDPLEEIADLCQEFGVWLHVDGAHSGAYLVSDTLRKRLKGLEKSDSFILDAHKMLLSPALATLVLFRDGQRSYETFSQQAAYLFEGAHPEDTWYDLAQRTLECTKRSLGFQVYGSLRLMGVQYFADYLESRVALSQAFAECIRQRPHWEMATEPEGNILCFRYLPPNGRDPNEYQNWVRERILQEGSFYLVKTTLRGHVYLRTTIINPRTRFEDLEKLLERVEKLV